MSSPDVIAFFVENRNGVRIAARLMAQLPDGVEARLVTADTEGLVTEWVSEESKRSNAFEVVNLFDGLRGVEGSNLKAELIQRLESWLNQERITRVAFFNDQSRRGRWITKAVGERPTILIQDGSLEFNFRVLTPGVKDQNWYYGTSGVSRVCVWGERNREQVLDRIPAEHPAPDIRVTGSVIHSADPELADAFDHKEAVRRRGDTGAPLSLILFDQPLGAQGKASAQDHLKAMKSVVSALNGRDRLTIKPHPSSDPALLKEIGRLPAVTVLPADVPVTREDLASYDAALTWFSTAFLDTMKAGVPIAFMSFPFLNIVMPEIKSELIRTTRSHDELHEVLTEFRQMGVFRANPAGVVPHALLRINPDVVGDVVDAILTAEPAEKLAEPVSARPTAPVVAPSGEPQVMTRAERALADLAADHGRPLKVVILGERLIQRIGVSLPAMELARHLAGTGQGEVRLVDLMEYAGIDEVLAEIRPDEVVVINSLRIFWIRPWMSALIGRLAQRGRTTFVYVHETRDVIEREHASFRKAHELMVEALKGAVVLCVSEDQRRMFKEWRVAAAYTVYNTTPGLVRGISRAPELPDGKRRRIVMVGSIQQRKGVDLFSRVAELARSESLPLDFEWIGGGSASPELYLSDAVEWSGHLSRPATMRALEAADVFFLSSSDDPMPLSAIEAVSKGLRTVTYGGVGTHEVMEGIAGYESFDLYEPREALDAILRVLESTPDYAAFDELVEMFSAEQFTARMITALSTAAPVVVEHSADPAPAAGAPRVYLERALANEDYDTARTLSRSFIRANPNPEGYRLLALSWLKAGFAPEALAILRTGHVLAENQEDYRSVAELTFNEAGMDASKINRWSASSITRRVWQLTRDRVRG
ncbi:glycosyltransferase family 4 protein [Demequina mangrovi]|uniref:Glycosyl transferases group 1 n=1 Tax=Demequina mangrovi TaxID=1043493 RepID=A0A1H7A4J4_9MICO|nr:glycosyltransferase family 4 protein [Demequina mangrovi]SEJ59354.1 Glycosyl transferases group 1 [Demequina mangrovi]